MIFWSKISNTRPHSYQSYWKHESFNYREHSEIEKAVTMFGEYWVVSHHFNLACECKGDLRCLKGKDRATYEGSYCTGISCCKHSLNVFGSSKYGKNYLEPSQCYCVKLLSGYQVLGCFSIKEVIEILANTHCQNSLWQRYHAKNYSTFLQKFVWITSNIMKYLAIWKSKFLCQKIFWSYLSQVTCASVQFNFNR